MPVTKENLAAVRSKIGMVFQDSDEQLFMPTVLEDVAFGPLNQGSTPEQAIAKATAALKQAGLEHVLDKAPYHLSAGEKRKVALAGVLAMDPEILVLDEPTTFLDPPAQRNLVHLLSELPQAKLIVTHDTRFAAALAQRAVFFERGKLVADGAIEEIVHRFDWTYSALAPRGFAEFGPTAPLSSGDPAARLGTQPASASLRFLGSRRPASAALSQQGPHFADLLLDSLLLQLQPFEGRG